MIMMLTDMQMLITESIITEDFLCKAILHKQFECR